MDAGDGIMNVNSSSSVVASNIDILTQILLFLPVKPLVQFKLVSKQWFSLISDSSFIRKHAVRSCSRPISGVFLQSSIPSVSEKQFLVLDEESNINVEGKSIILNNIISEDKMILQSCNGLFLCRHRGPSYHGYIFSGSLGYTYYICNPATGHNKIVPPPPSFDSCGTSSRNHNFSFALDPIKSPYYDVIYVEVTSLFNLLFNYHIEIYSSKTDSWRVSGEHMVEVSCSLASSGVFWNGSLHLMPSSANVSRLIYFDIDRGLLKTMPMPASPDGSRERIEYFGECKGNLYLIKFPYGLEFDIYELEVDYSGWSKRHHVDLKELPFAFLDADKKFLFYFNVLLVEEIENDALKLVLLIPNCYVSYDLKERSFKLIPGVVPAGFRTNVPLMGLQVVAHQFVNSLASV